MSAVGVNRGLLKVIGVVMLAIGVVAAVVKVVGLGDWTAVSLPLALADVSLMYVFTSSAQTVSSTSQRHRPHPGQLLLLVVIAVIAVVAGFAAAVKRPEVFTGVLEAAVVAIVCLVVARAVRSPESSATV